MDESQVFTNALKLAAAAERAVYLDEACGGDPRLRAAVEALLQAHEADPGFLEQPAGPIGETIAGAPPSRPPGSPPTLPADIRQPGAVLAGRYKLLERIGEGGMGTVWMAQQTEPVKRLVAVKLIKPGMDTRQVIARFEAERQALALMDHPNIARVLDAGVAPDGRPFFVMELVKGIPITRYCDDHRLTPRQRLELFVPVCQAIQHAHQKGIIHRDLKPSNVLVARYDDRPVPKVIDFGVAKATGQQLTEQTLHTGFGAVVGTVEYMSPEQAGFNQLDVDTRSDIYSLGVLLYELLTGTTPLDRKRLKESTLLEVLRTIREVEPPRPSARLSTADGLPALATNRGTEPKRLTALVRGELDWIVMKALEKDRGRRYETANSLALDVQRYLADEPVLACPPSTFYRLRKFARRNKALFLTASAIAVALLVAVATLAVSSVLVWQAKDDLQVALDRERHDGYFHRIALAHRELSRDNLGRALEQLDQCPEELRQWEWYCLKRLCRVEPVVLRDKAEVNGIAFSPKGEWIASAGGDGAIKIWNSRTREVVQTLDAHRDSVYSVVFHRHGKYLASTGADRKVKVWDWTTGRNVFTGPSGADHNRGTAYGVAFSPDGRRLAAGSDGAVHVWDWGNEQLLLTLPGHAKKGISVAFSPDGRRLASGSWTGDVMIWDAATGERLHTLCEHRHPVSALAFSPDGRRLVSACFDRSLIVWDATTGQPLHTLGKHDGLVLGVAFSPDGSRLASTGEDKTVRVWEAATDREILDLRGHTELSQGVTFSPDGSRLASASSDGTIRVWDAAPLQGNEGREAFTFRQRASEVWTLAVSPDREGRWIASAGLGGDRSLVEVWDARSGRVSAAFAGHRSVVFCVAWHPDPDGLRIASSGWGAERKRFVVKVWDVRTRAVAFELPAGMETFALAFSPDDKYLVTGRAGGAVQVWDARTGREVGTLGRHGQHIRGVVFSRDGRYLASASGDGVVKLWDWDATRLGQEQKPLHSFRARVPLTAMTLGFSPDSRRLVAGGHEHTVKIWDVTDGRELHTLQGHSGDVWAATFSPDREGRWIASAGEDSTVKVWDSHTGTLVRSFRGHTGLVSSLAFSPDGRRLFSGSRDKTVKVWDLTQLSGDVGDR